MPSQNAIEVVQQKPSSIKDSTEESNGEQRECTEVIIEETGPSTDNDGRTTAVFADPSNQGSSCDKTSFSASGGGGTENNQNHTNTNGSEPNFAAHL